jgi:hypothetical protein
MKNSYLKSRKPLAVQANVTEEEDAERAITEDVKEFDRIDYAA